MNDLRLAFRSLARTPGYSAVIIFTLALGIGANTAIFSFFNGILLRPLPYAEPDRVVVLKKSADDYNDPVGAETGLYAADFRELQPALRTLSAVSTYTLDSVTVTESGSAELASAAVVTPNFFAVLGSEALHGRTFSPTDVSAGAPRLATIAHDYWISHFGGDHSVLGRTIIANHVPFTVVGVMPPDFDFPREAQLWVMPATDVPETAIGQPEMDFSGRGGNLRTIFGRLAPGVTASQAAGELKSVFARLPNPNQVKRAEHLVNLRDHTIGEVRPALTVLLACVGLVLLIACLNVSNLMLSRAIGREREISIRIALGAARWHIARQLLAESLVLAGAGCLLGLLFSAWALELLLRVAPAALPRLATISVDGRVLAFATVASLVAGLGSGLAPILGTTRTGLSGSIKSGDRAGSAGPAPRRLRAALVAGEVAISLVLLVAAGLLVRSLVRMESLSWGFVPEQIVSARVSFLDERYASNEARINFYRTLRSRLTGAPGVEAIGTSLDRVGVSWINQPFTAAGQHYANPADRPMANYKVISPGYIRTMGISVLQGREFNETDGPNGERGVLIDAAIAQRYYGRDAIGRTIKLVSPEGDIDVPIVGVVSSVRSDGPVGAGRPDIYVPYLAYPQNNFHLHVRTPLSPAAAEALIRQAVREIDPGAPVTDFATMTEIVARPTLARRFPLGLLGAFAGLALVLAAVGIYALTSHAVTQRTREIGVRMALGAPLASVAGLVLRQGFVPICAGLGGGLVASALTAFAMRRLLFDVAPLDAPTFFLVPAGLALIALFACLLPARRATKIDPIEALRAE
ncbi:MAG TPA: ABC transporter permease [Lacunisphaera sp.]|nr:ABC transporter permease [Lacunisphaera sp.]